MNRQEYLEQVKADALRRSGKACKQCGEMFIPKGGRKTINTGTFCSRKCRGTWMRGQKRKKVKSCRVRFVWCDTCGEPLPLRGYSKRCKVCWGYKRKRKTCVHCGQPLTGIKSKYCSSYCLSACNCDPYYWEWLFWGERKAKCFLCDKEYVMKAPNQIFCNEKCRKRAERIIGNHSDYLPSVQDARRLRIEDAYREFFKLRKESRNERRWEERYC